MYIYDIYRITFVYAQKELHGLDLCFFGILLHMRLHMAFVQFKRQIRSSFKQGAFVVRPSHSARMSQELGTLGTDDHRSCWDVLLR